MKHQLSHYTPSPSSDEAYKSETPSMSHNSDTFELKMLNNQLFGIRDEHSSRPPLSSSIISPIDTHAHPSPSSAIEKSKMTRQYLVIVLGISYGLFLVTFGAICFIGNALVDVHPVPQVFSIFMLLVGFVYFIYLMIHIRLHVATTKRLQVEREKARNLNEQSSTSECLSISSSVCDVFDNSSHIKSYNLTSNSPNPPHHNYCFITGRHGELLYLKLGATCFCFGLIIHSILSLAYQVVYIRENSGCADPYQLAVDIMFPLYSLFILFFIFKFCNVVINCHQSVAKILLMHGMGSMLAFWIYSVVNETVNAINLKRKDDEMENATIIEQPTSDPNQSSPLVLSFFNSSKNFALDCPSPEELNLIYRYIEPYLYPFVIEFCILTVGIYYMIWSNINNCPSRKEKNENLAFVSLESIPEAINVGLRRRRGEGVRINERNACNTVRIGHEEQIKSSLVVYADCHASSRGLFAGMILLIFKIVTMILIHVTAQASEYGKTTILIDRILELLVLIILTIATIIAYVKTSQFDINHHPMSKLDDVLLFIAIPAFFSETIFSLVPAIYNRTILNILIIMSQLIQILIQTPWIIDALRRCANSPELRRLKPGRELVTFLTISNVALWIYYTFTIKTTSDRDERYEFYGDKLWTILNHLSLPLIMFYRFHASVCLVDIWKHSYESGEGH